MLNELRLVFYFCLLQQLGFAYSRQFAPANSTATSLNNKITKNARLQGGGVLAGSPTKTAGKGVNVIFGDYTDDVSELFSVYNPFWIAQLWPSLKNGVHVNVNADCWDHVGVFTRDLLQGRAWTYNMIDATGHYESGLLSGQTQWLGSKEACDILSNNEASEQSDDDQTDMRRQDYLTNIERQQLTLGVQETQKVFSHDDLFQSIIRADNVPPYSVGYSSVSAQLNLTKPTIYLTRNIIMGLCFPSTCTASDIAEILEFSIISNDNLRTGKTLQRKLKIIQVRTLYEPLNILKEPSFAILLIFFAVITILTACGTLIDYDIINILSNNSGSLRITTENPVVQNTVATSTIDNISIDRVPCDKVNRNFDVTNPIADNEHNRRVITKLDMEPALHGVIPRKYTEIHHSLRNMNSLVYSHCKRNRSADDLHLPVDVRTETTCDGTNCRKCGKMKKNYHQKHSSTCCSLRGSEHTNSRGTLESARSDVASVKKIERIYEESPIKNILLSFSLRINFHKMFEMAKSDNDLASIHGLKVYTLLWVMLIHTCLISSYSSDGNAAASSFIDYVIIGGTHAFDTIFFIGGLITMYALSNQSGGESSKPLWSSSRLLGRLVDAFTFIGCSWIRLVPPYAVAIMLTQLSARANHLQRPVELPDRDDLTCAGYWWRNILYVNNIYPGTETCGVWSWYLTGEAQLVAACALAAALAARARPRLAACVALAASLASCGATAVAAYRLEQDYRSLKPHVLYKELYTKSWSRVTPFFIGVAAGWMLIRTKNKISVGIHFTRALWSASLFTLILLAVALPAAPLPLAARALLAGVERALWPAAVAWLAVAAITGNAEFLRRALCWRALRPLSRAGYCAYLLHSLLAPSYVHAPSPYNLTTSYLGVVAMTFAAAMLLSLVVEAPLIALTRQLQTRARRSDAAFELQLPPKECINMAYSGSERSQRSRRPSIEHYRI